MNNSGMEKTYEQRRILLQAFVKKLGRGATAAIARATGIDASYLSRCLYPVGKRGRKNIGDETVVKLDEHFPEWRGEQGAMLFAIPDLEKGDPNEEMRRGLSSAAVLFGHVFDKMNPVDQFDLWVDLKKKMMNYPKAQQDNMAEIVKYLTAV